MILWVVKVGTSLLRGNKDHPTASVIEGFSEAIAQCHKKGDRVVLVTSGAVGLGCNKLGLKKRPEDVISLQAAASIGQGQLMALYEAKMKLKNIKVAQVLLTRADLGSRNNYRNASNTLKRLLDWGVLPIVNENDVLSTEELRFGDNDTLSALVAAAIGADQLILLTDVDRLYSDNPRTNSEAKPITDVLHTDQIQCFSDGINEVHTWGTGGMTTKLAAARIATASGITVHLADGRSPEMLTDLFQGSRGGTVFHPHPSPIGNRKSWLAHALKPLGELTLDEGASNAIKNQGASLLLVGVKKIDGNFSANQAVRIMNHTGIEIARGISSLSSEELQLSLVSQNAQETKSPVVIHRDVLVLTEGLIS
ncbi:glutamate 5-kinase [Prochlorococcus sp. MIT 1300]|uniref:glutamate 5-kinase n=1 Tax=Prochlorococcus sp. MIT 1300 TaxID=3096218 RepID=UPI002A755FC1|nr:glutamate 5-kinase [Prochlorococcus sp. MIT 1300]